MGFLHSKTIKLPIWFKWLFHAGGVIDTGRLLSAYVNLFMTLSNCYDSKSLQEVTCETWRTLLLCFEKQKNSPGPGFVCFTYTKPELTAKVSFPNPNTSWPNTQEPHIWAGFWKLPPTPRQQSTIQAAGSPCCWKARTEGHCARSTDACPQPSACHLHLAGSKSSQELRHKSDTQQREGSKFWNSWVSVLSASPTKCESLEQILSPHHLSF